MFDPKIKSTSFFRVIALFQVVILSVFFIAPSSVVQAQTFSVLSLPKPGAMVTTSQKFDPLLIKGISLHKENPLVFDFILDPGDSGYGDDQIKIEGQRLIKYFLAALTVPEKDLWVNLSPYEKDRIIPEGFGQTEMGRDLLAQDYILKQLSASLIYPEKDLGKEFWTRVYRKAKAAYGTTDIPLNTFNKVWIVPDTAIIVENKTSAYVTRSHLKVMLEEDYISLNENRASEVLGTSYLQENDVKNLSKTTSAIVRDIILPEIEKEVNEGKNFAQLRQVYYSLLLATWFKINLKDNILNEIYSDQYKVLGINVKDKTDKEKIYTQYLAAFRAGVFNYIKEDLDETTKEIIPRKYFSGGTAFDRTRDAIQLISGETPAGQAERAASTANKPQVIMTSGLSRPEPTVDQEIMAQRIKELKSDDQQIRIQAIQELSREGDGVAMESLIELLTKTPETVVLFDNPKAINSEYGMIQTVINEIGNRLRLSSNPQVRRLGLLATVRERIDAFIKGGMSILDAAYLKALYTKFLRGREELQLNKTIIATANFEATARKSVFGVYDSKEIVGSVLNRVAAKTVAVDVIQMKGGLGTSYERKETVKRITGRDNLADKATDSYFEDVDINGGKVSVNVASLKAQQYVHLAEQGAFAEIKVTELVNDESLGPVTQFYSSPYYLDPTKTIGQKFQETPGLSLDTQMIVQGVLPVVDAETSEFIVNPKATAPGGHGFLGTLTLNRIADTVPASNKPAVTVIVNGDGVNNFIPEEVVGWMVQKKIPIVMITTTKTGLDIKGGLVVAESGQQLSQEITDKLNQGKLLNQSDMGDLTLTAQLFEIAQAKSVGQEKLFQETGLTKGEPGGQLFNTNLSAYNENVLHPFLSELKKILGPDHYFEITSPDLIANKKEKDIDGVKKDVFQMEGAKGSVLLNLNKFVMTTTDPQVIELKRKYGIDRLVYFVNFDADNRTEVFTPEKYAWDHGVFERSDLFSVNINTGRLEKHGHPGKLPAIDLDKYYTNIENINRAWGKQVGMQDLDFLGIKGKVHFPNALLIGNVVIESAAADVIDLNNFKQSFKTTDNGRLVLENVYITITAAGELSVAAISDAKQAIAKFEGRENEQVPATVIQQEISVETGEIKAAQKLLSSALDNPLGGIDFNPAMIKMEINKQNGGVTVEFDPKLLEEIRSQGIEGFVPVILNIQRVQSVVPLLSQNIDKAFSSLASI